MAKKIKVIDDIGLDGDISGDKTMDELDQNKLEALKNKLKIEAKKEDAVSLRFGIIGAGHAGSRIAEAFYNLGYPAIAFNTATQDLAHIRLPEENKLFTDVSLQGAAKDLTRGEAAAQQYRDKIQELIYDKLSSAQVLILCSSSGGGSGAGSLPTLIDICNSTGKPIVLISILPMVSEDSKTKSNSLETVAKLAGYIKDGKAHSFILVDNAKIESLQSGISEMEFYGVANKIIVEPLDVFNKYSMLPSQVKALDSAEWATLLLNSGGISTYGQIIIGDYTEDTSIAEAVVASLQKNMLAGGLDYKQARYVGYIVIANKEVWNKIPAGAINYANAMINDIFGNPEATYKGIYEADIPENAIKIYTFVSGLGVPAERMSGLKKDIDVQQQNLKTKDDDRAKKLTVDLGKSDVVSDVEKIKQKIRANMSGLGKLTGMPKK